MTGSVFNVQRGCVQDGPGIRTTVFLKGCHLRCAWCHNPESHLTAPQIMFDPKKCIFCGACATACARHSLENGVHVFNREGCVGCGKCAANCYAGALEVCGKAMSVDKVMEVVRRDVDFYGGDGGLTISGGEPLTQIDFTLALARAAKDENIGVCIETSGDIQTPRILELAQYVDIFLYDIKLLDEAAHIRYTGISNRRILENLRALDDAGARTILRCPIIPDINLLGAHFEAVARLAESLKNVSEVQFEPYHPLGAQKAARLGEAVAYDNPEFLPRAEVEALAQKAQPLTRVRLSVQ